MGTYLRKDMIVKTITEEALTLRLILFRGPRRLYTSPSCGRAVVIPQGPWQR